MVAMIQSRSYLPWNWVINLNDLKQKFKDTKCQGKENNDLQEPLTWAMMAFKFKIEMIKGSKQDANS